MLTNRRLDREYREVKHTYLSVLLSGTPMQVKPFIPSAENGLFSRNLFYYMPRVDQWVNQFSRDGTDVEAEFRHMGGGMESFPRRTETAGYLHPAIDRCTAGGVQ